MPPRPRLRIDFPALIKKVAIDAVDAIEDLVKRDGLDTRPRSYELIRPEDLLHLRVRFEHMAPGAGGAWFSTRAPEPGLLIFHLPPQHVFEFAVLEGQSAPPQVASYLALPSRVVIRVPADRGVELSIRGLLTALYEHDMQLSAAARGVGPLRKPTAALAEAAQPRSIEESVRFGRLMRAHDAKADSSTIVGVFAESLQAVVRREAGEALDAIRGLIKDLGQRFEEIARISLAQPGDPAADETAIEIPWRLILSPTTGSRWTHRVGLARPSPAGRHELWHTRLAVVGADGRRDESTEAPARKARAVWTRDPDFLGTWEPPRPDAKAYEEAKDGSSPALALSRSDRTKIVAATTDSRLPGGAPVHVRRWMLSSQGGWIDLHGSWRGHATGLVGWEHRATVGRDQFVRLEYAGWLWPFGIAASLVKITERKLRAQARDQAFLWQRSFLRVLVPYRQWTAANLDQERCKPFHSVEVQLRETPDVEYWGQTLQPATPDPKQVLIPHRGGRAFRFPVAAVDHDDNVVIFDQPMIFVPDPLPAGTPPAAQPDLMAFLEQLYAQKFDAGTEGRADLRGQRVALAPSSKQPDRAGDARHETAWMRITAVAEAGAKPRSMPQLKQAGLVLESMRALTGSTGPVTVSHHPHYRASGFDATNPAGVFLALVDKPATEFGKNTEKVGGFLSPDMAMTALSRAQGPVAGKDVGGFNPADFFGALADKAKLFGTLKLTEIIKPGSFDAAPKFVTQAFDLVESVIAELRRWQAVAERLWEQLKIALASAPPSVEAAIDQVLQQTQVKKSVEDVLAKVGITLPATFTFTFDEWQAMVIAVGKAGVDHVKALAAALADAVVAEVQKLLGASKAVELLSTLWAAAVEAGAMIGTVTALPSIIGTAAPDVAVEAISRLFTQVAARVEAVTRPGSPLADVVAGIPGLAPKERHEITERLTQASQLLTELKDKLGPPLHAYAVGQELARNLTVKLSWSTELLPFGGGEPGQRLFQPTGKLTLAGEMRGKAVGKQPAGIDLKAEIGAFTLNLIAPLTFIGIGFKHIRFELAAGKKPDLDVQLIEGGFQFKGPLEFVESLRKVIPLDGFSDPPALAITPQGVDATFSLALPSVAIGVFSLTNLSLSAGFTIPFLGETPLSVRFGFCSREHPFTLTVSMLGGGGFFAICINPKGVQQIEAALEFGACLAIDLGVASGSVSIMAGVYFKMAAVEGGGTAVTLTGYLRLRGEVDVLHLISASIELYMSLTYESETGMVIGKAMIEVRVKVLFLSFGVKIEMEKRFAGSSGDPTFLDVMAPYLAEGKAIEPWLDYLNAFDAAA